MNEKGKITWSKAKNIETKPKKKNIFQKIWHFILYLEFPEDEPEDIIKPVPDNDYYYDDPCGAVDSGDYYFDSVDGCGDVYYDGLDGCSDYGVIIEGKTEDGF